MNPVVMQLAVRGLLGRRRSLLLVVLPALLLGLAGLTRWASHAQPGASAGLTGAAPVVASLVGLYLGDPLPVDYDGAQQTDEQLYARLFHELLERGVAIAPGAYEALFPGLAHDDDVLDHLVSAMAEAATAVASRA